MLKSRLRSSRFRNRLIPAKVSQLRSWRVGLALALWSAGLARVAAGVGRWNIWRNAVVVIFLLGAGILGLAMRAPQAHGDVSYCPTVSQFETQWTFVNISQPGAPFFSDGNNDGIADMLQLRHRDLPGLAAGLMAVADAVPAGPQRSLRTLATDVDKLASEPVPVNAVQSRQQTAAIESIAPSVQNSLKVCSAEASAALSVDPNAPGDLYNSSGQLVHQGAPAPNKTDWSVAATLLFLILNLPLMYWVWRHARRPKLDGGATRFVGNLRRWAVDTQTGEVLGVTPHVDIHTTWTQGVYDYAPVRTTTRTTTETIRLQPFVGRPRDVPLVNFAATPSVGDLITVGEGRKRSRSVPFAVLNHTTGRQVVHPQNLFSLRAGGCFRQTLFVLVFVFGSLASCVVAILGGVPLLLLVWLGLGAAFAVFSRREASMNLAPLWQRARNELRTSPPNSSPTRP